MHLKKTIKHLIESKNILITLAVRDVRYRYFSSIGGSLWLVLEPIVFVALLWLIFSNFKSAPDTAIPFLAYLATGFCLWQFFATAIAGGTNSVRQYSYLVTKINFPIYIIPVVKVFSALILNFIFLGIIFILLPTLGITPSIKWALVLYYQFSLSVLVLGLIYITSAVNIFVKDISELVNIIVRFGFWLTPIFWSVDLMSDKVVYILSFNPLFYLVEGFREALLTGYSSHSSGDHLYYWTFTLITFSLGVVTFKKLKPYFAEAL
jgi:ABC-type polysaccharide/polyol phosphate export permease